MLPNFIVIGAGKAGTTSLWGYLGDHPEVFVSNPKELNFFTVEHNWHKGLEWYERHFEAAGGAKAVGEVSGNYTNWPQYDGVPARMAKTVPDARLIYVVRDPIERIVSAYRYMRVMGHEEQPIEQALQTRPVYLNVSRYATQIERYLEYFQREQLCIVVSEDLRADRENALRRVFAFLGVDPNVMPATMVREFNRTDRKLRQPRSAAQLALRLPFAGAVNRRMPAPVKSLARRLGTRPVMRQEEGHLPQDVRAWLEEELREEARRMREYLGPTFHCWGLG